MLSIPELREIAKNFNSAGLPLNQEFSGIFGDTDSGRDITAEELYQFISNSILLQVNSLHDNQASEYILLCELLNKLFKNERNDDHTLLALQQLNKQAKVTKTAILQVALHLNPLVLIEQYHALTQKFNDDTGVLLDELYKLENPTSHVSNLLKLHDQKINLNPKELSLFFAHNSPDKLTEALIDLNTSGIKLSDSQKEKIFKAGDSSELVSSYKALNKLVIQPVFDEILSNPSNDCNLVSLSSDPMKMGARILGLTGGTPTYALYNNNVYFIRPDSHVISLPLAKTDSITVVENSFPKTPDILKPALKSDLEKITSVTDHRFTALTELIIQLNFPLSELQISEINKKDNFALIYEALAAIKDINETLLNEPANIDALIKHTRADFVLRAVKTKVATKGNLTQADLTEIYKNPYENWRSDDVPKFEGKAPTVNEDLLIGKSDLLKEEVKKKVREDYEDAMQVAEQSVADVALSYVQEKKGVTSAFHSADTALNNPLLEFANVYSQRYLDLLEAFIDMEIAAGIPMIPVDVGQMKLAGFTSKEIIDMQSGCREYLKLVGTLKELVPPSSFDDMKVIMTSNNWDLKANEIFKLPKEDFISRSMLKGCGLIKFSDNPNNIPKEKLKEYLTNKAAYALYKDQVYYIDANLKLRSLAVTDIAAVKVLFPSKFDTIKGATAANFTILEKETKHSHKHPEITDTDFEAIKDIFKEYDRLPVVDKSQIKRALFLLHDFSHMSYDQIDEQLALVASFKPAKKGAFETAGELKPLRDERLLMEIRHRIAGDSSVHQNSPGTLGGNPLAYLNLVRGKNRDAGCGLFEVANNPQLGTFEELSPLLNGRDAVIKHDDSLYYVNYQSKTIKKIDENPENSKDLITLKAQFKEGYHLINNKNDLKQINDLTGRKPDINLEAEFRNKMFFVYMCNHFANAVISVYNAGLGIDFGEDSHQNADKIVKSINNWLNSEGKGWQLDTNFISSMRLRGRNYIPPVFRYGANAGLNSIYRVSRHDYDVAQFYQSHENISVQEAMEGTAPLKAQHRSRLSDREYFAQTGELTYKKGSAAANENPLNFGTGAAIFDLRKANDPEVTWSPATVEYLTQIDALGLPICAGISGTLDQSTTMAGIVGLGVSEDPAKRKLELETIRLAYLAFMLPGGDHTVHEIMQSSKTFGLDYVAGPGFEQFIFPTDGAQVAQAFKEAQQARNSEIPAHYYSDTHVSKVIQDVEMQMQQSLAQFNEFQIRLTGVKGNELKPELAKKLAQADYLKILEYFTDDKNQNLIDKLLLVQPGEAHRFPKDAKLPRTVTIIRNMDGEYKLIVETKSKLASGLKDPDMPVIRGAIKSGKPCYRLDVPEDYFGLTMSVDADDPQAKAHVEEIRKESDLSQELAKGSDNICATDLGVEYERNNKKKISVYSRKGIGTLDKVLGELQGNEAAKEKLIADLLNAVKAMHKKGYAHQDLKPQNLLVFKDEVGNYTLKLIDFGEAKKSGDKEAYSAGPHKFQSPEQAYYYTNPYDADSSNKAYGDKYFARKLGILGRQVADNPEYEKIYKKDLAAHLNLQIDEEKGLPDIKNRDKYKSPNTANDMWAVGMLVYYIQHGELPENIASLQKVQKDPLLSGLLEPDRSKRLSIDEALKINEQLAKESARDYDNYQALQQHSYLSIDLTTKNELVEALQVKLPDCTLEEKIQLKLGHLEYINPTDRAKPVSADIYNLLIPEIAYVLARYEQLDFKLKSFSNKEGKIEATFEELSLQLMSLRNELNQKIQEVAPQVKLVWEGGDEGLAKVVVAQAAPAFAPPVIADDLKFAAESIHLVHDVGDNSINDGEFQLKEKVPSGELQQRTPYKVKEQEFQRLNVGYTNLSDREKPFEPVEGVKYIWIYTKKNELVIGVEEPWKYPQAFVDVKNEPLLANFTRLFKAPPGLSNKARNPHQQMLGHPTLTTGFDNRGEALSYSGAVIGGEFEYVGNQWVVTNESGRYGSVMNASPAEVKELMKGITEQFNTQTTVSADFCIVDTFYKEWKKGEEPASAIHLLQSYLDDDANKEKPSYEMVKEFLARVDVNSISSEEILNHCANNFKDDPNTSDGALLGRLKFIATQTNTTFTLPEGTRGYNL